MGAFEVVLEVIRGAKSTGRRMSMTVLGRDRLSAAISAEESADALLSDQATMYTHALSVTPLRPRTARAMLPLAA